MDLKNIKFDGLNFGVDKNGHINVEIKTREKSKVEKIVDKIKSWFGK
jgi:preprotein translocase subunit SecF